MVLVQLEVSGLGPDLSLSDQGAGHLLSPPDLLCAQSSFSGEVEAQTIGGDQGPSLVRLSQNPPQGEVQDVSGGVVAHDGPAPSLRKGPVQYLAFRSNCEPTSDSPRLRAGSPCLPPAGSHKPSPRAERSLLGPECSSPRTPSSENTAQLRHTKNPGFSPPSGLPEHN